MTYHEYDEPHADLRELISRIDKSGELVRVSGVDIDLELGTLVELIAHHGGEGGPAVLFEDVVGAPSGHRLMSGATNSANRLALTLGLPRPGHPMDVVRSYRDRMKTHEPIPPEYVDDGPILENVLRDDEVDVTALGAPTLHELDGGPYIGTDDAVVMADPDDGWVNVGTYRVQVHGPDRVGLWTSPGKQGRQIRDKYFAQGKPCPVLISCGHDPLLFLASGNEIRYGLSEYDYAGGHRGRPFEVVRSELHGLPMPARAELVLEGELYPGDLAPEGPFGEFTGYYAGGRSDQPVVRVRRIYHRTDPIMTVASPIRPPSNFSYSKCVMKAGMIWDEVERAGLAGVTGVWCHEAGAARMFNVIAIRQAYAGHARQAGLLAASCQSGSYLGRFVVVVDDDIDPANTFDVLWAMSTRCDPAEDIEIVRGAWSGPLDPRLPAGVNRNSRAVVSAVRPFERIAEFPPVAEASPELRARVADKFAAVLDGLAGVKEGRR
ncbi:MAG: UbiD family decarboxylase [Actinophytocola sp.]|uniref:UbiD family decarboxylase n=1 Tax=Actinophytocola sp. TaxID=1872138 RepID=UPI0013276562|nr:UbiD family decarboxylase [Actinophytocola sp.]MPZ79245.1 UbiD family decarboxylase [Actinophytocola sp.]